MSSHPYCQVIAPRPVRSLFTYSVPPDLDRDAVPGKRVIIPFGTKTLIGLLVKRVKTAEVKTKEIISVLDLEPAVPPKLLKLAMWTADYYFAPPGDVAQLVLPRMDAKIDTMIELTCDEPPQTRSKNAMNVYHALEIKGGSRKLDLLASDLGLTPGQMKKILASETVRRFTKQLQSARSVKKRKAEPVETKSSLQPVDVELTDEQRTAVKEIAPDIENGEFKVHLVHGVTGSGKTEVYASLAKSALERGKTVLVLAPEIAIAGLIANRFSKRLGVEAAVIHSDLKSSVRSARWEAAARGDVQVVVGARSAVFVPLDNLGLIIVDEEHDTAYKQGESPRYNGRDVAVKRGSIESVPVVLGSATPSMESLYNAGKGKYGLVKLTSRLDGRNMPAIELAGLEWGEEIGYKLAEEMKTAIDSGGQTLLFLNRRGAARYIQCEACGHVFECRNCSLSLVFHSGPKTLNCHTCGYVEPAPAVCPECHSDRLFEGGAGTQKLEERVKTMFPQAKVARMDRDTTSKRDSAAKILSDVESGGVDVLVGTQMVTKGHDYPGITLVGVVSADDILHVPDFRASERAFQQITQAAGRAGRGERPGRVIVQSRGMDHHSITAAAAQNFESFYETESELRKMAGYPPFARLAMARIETVSKETGERFTERLRPLIHSVMTETAGLTILGPAEAVVFKVRNWRRWKILFKASSPKTLAAGISRFLEGAEKESEKAQGRVKIIIDVDPADVM